MSKRTAVAKQRIQQFYFQLTDGCGRPNCSNPDCASNPNSIKLTSNDAAAKAILLFNNKKSLCDKPPSKVPRTDIKQPEEQTVLSEASLPIKNGIVDAETSGKKLVSSSCHSDQSNIKTVSNGDNILSKTKITTKLSKTSDDKGEKCNVVEDTKININKDVKNVDESKTSTNSASTSCDDGISTKLKSIFVTKPSTYIGPTIDDAEKLFNSGKDEKSLLSAAKDLFWQLFSSSDCLNKCALLKEDFKSQQCTDEDKDVDESDKKDSKPKISMDDLEDDSTDTSNATSSTSQASKQSSIKKCIHPTVDMIRIRLFNKYFDDYPSLTTVTLNAITYLSNEVERQLIANKEAYKNDPNYLNMFVILMDNPVIQGPDGLNTVFPKFCKVLSRLPVSAQAILAKYWAKSGESFIRNVIENLQQIITVKIVSELDDSDDSLGEIHTNEGIVSAAKCLNIFYYASILGGTVDKRGNRTDITTSKQSNQNKEVEFLSFLDKDSDQFSWVDPLGKELDLKRLDCVKPLVPLLEFVNEHLNEVLKIDKDYTNFKINQQGTSRFSFLHCPFMLTLSNKITHLFYDNRITMYSERRKTFISSIVQGEMIHPYLKLSIRRNHVIEDTLFQLEYASDKDFKKQLFVEFDKEEGVDEGGVSKEFFQLIIDELFNPEKGVFVYDEDTRLYWFNAHSFESKTQFKLIGIVLGLAIYNNCILDVNFPSFVYKKLLGKDARFSDMEKFQPVLYRSLLNLLNYEGNVEEDLMLSFRIEYQDVFGNLHHHDLKENGENIPVTKENRQEYVDMYADWMLNLSVAECFNEFMKGFDLVVSDSPLKYLFDDLELELLIRGSEDYDFEELERTTKYDGGFTKQSKTIVDFWSVLHQLTEQEKRSLLQFSTGSDRAPVGGLGKLKMIIARNGPDSARLPTAHTCFNVILLPDYKNREKLKERLLKAIKYSKGFGML